MNNSNATVKHYVYSNIASFLALAVATVFVVGLLLAVSSAYS